ncbi:MAG: DUF945 family protein [Thiofilum sp.]|uniref:DUF945 family protein n=1 Tax=Thiofilum sp. TaxID=2212733 RepID=UPI0025FD02F9|nr:DUF945 family protein [Thiofilum sp.]MBK8453783.1 DUF945 family protein [Thiofilum sp.]
MSKAAYLLALPVVVAAAWGGSTWYVGQQTKGVMDEFIKKNNELNSVHGLQQEVVSYDQGFLNSKAVIKLNMTQPPFNELVKDLRFNAEIKNGPVLMGDGGIGTGLSRWIITLDQESIQDATIKSAVKEAFGGKDPFVGTMDIGFGNNYDSKVVVNPISYKADGNDLSFAGATITGTGNADEYTGKAKLEGGEFKATLEDGTVITAPKTTADVDMTGLVGSSLLGTMQFKSSQVSFKTKDMPEISLDLGVDTKSDKVDQVLNGTVGFSATNIKGVPEDMLSNARYDLAYNDFKVEGIEELTKLQNELQNVQSQIDFNDANTETPEGQKKTMELFGKIQEIGGKMMETAFTKMLVADKSRLTQKIALDNPKGKTQLDIDLTYHGGDKVPTMNDLMMQTFSAEQWANLVRGSVILNADKAMLPPIAGMMLMQPVEQGLLEDSANQYKLNLKLNGEQVELNGKAMPIMELFTKVVGGAGAAPAAEGEEELPEMSSEGVTAAELESLGVPADIAKEMEANGLTPEIMKKLEDNKDISPEVLEMMRQLQQMQQGTEGTAPDQPAPAQ